MTPDWLENFNDVSGGTNHRPEAKSSQQPNVEVPNAMLGNFSPGEDSQLVPVAKVP